MKKIILALVLIAGAAYFTALKFQLGPFRQEPSKVVEEEEDVNVIIASGKVQAKNVANLSFPSGGLLSWVGVKEGDNVRKFQGIASLDRRQLEKNLARQMNLYLTNRWDFEQTQDNFKEKKERFLITDADKRTLDKAQFSLNNAVIDVELADIAQKLATISTPISGIVTRIDTPFAGVNISPTSTFTIIDPHSVYFSADVDESDIGKIKVGQKAIITLEAHSESFTGNVKYIGFTAVQTTGGGTSFPVEISLPQNTNLMFKIGMNGDAEIIFQ